MKKLKQVKEEVLVFFPLSEIEKQPYEEGCVNLSPSSHNCFKHWSLFEGSDLIKNCGITLKRGRN